VTARAFAGTAARPQSTAEKHGSCRLFVKLWRDQTGRGGSVMTRLRKPGYRLLAEFVALPSAITAATLVLAVLVG